MSKCKKVAPVLVVRNLTESVEFWRDKVGFTPNVYGDPPNFAMLNRDDVTIMLAEAPSGANPPLPNWRVASKTNQCYIWVDDASAMYAELRATGAPIDFTLYDTPWGTREFGIQDLDGYDIAFGQVL